MISACMISSCEASLTSEDPDYNDNDDDGDHSSMRDLQSTIVRS